MKNKEVKTLNIKRVGVDAGMIMVCDEDYYNYYGKTINYGKNEFGVVCSQKFDIEPGVYNVEWSIKNTWNGDIAGKGIIRIVSGRLTVSDPCYCIRDWDKWLAETNIGDNVSDNVILIDEMGGDGCYDIDLKLSKQV